MPGDAPQFPTSDADWTYDIALMAVTDGKFDLHTPTTPTNGWLTFDPNLDFGAADAAFAGAVGFAHHTFYAAKINRDGLKAWADAVQAISSVIGEIEAGSYGAMNVQTLNDLATMVTALDTWLQSRSTDFHKFAADLHSKDSGFKGTAAFVISDRLRHTGDTLDDLHRQLTTKNGVGVPKASTDAYLALQAFGREMAAHWYPVANYLADFPQTHITWWLQRVDDFLDSWGFFKKGPHPIRNDSYFRKRLAQFPMADGTQSDLAWASTWEAMSLDITTRLKAEIQTYLDKPAADSMNRLRTVYEASASAMIKLVAPSVPPTVIPGPDGGGDPPPNNTPPPPNLNTDTPPPPDSNKNTPPPGGPANLSNLPNGPANLPNGPANLANLPNGPANLANLPNGPANLANLPNGPANLANLPNGPANLANLPNGPANLANTPLPLPFSGLPNLANKPLPKGPANQANQPLPKSPLDLGKQPPADLTTLPPLPPPIGGANRGKLPPVGGPTGGPAPTGIRSSPQGNSKSGLQSPALTSLHGGGPNGLSGLTESRVPGTGLPGSGLTGLTGSGSTGTGLTGSGLAGNGSPGNGLTGISGQPGTSGSAAPGSQNNAGGVPFFPPMMGGGGGAGAGEKPQERERQTWLAEDESVWGTDVAAGSGVIGRLEDEESAEEILVASLPGQERLHPAIHRRRRTEESEQRSTAHIEERPGAQAEERSAPQTGEGPGQAGQAPGAQAQERPAESVAPAATT